MRDLTKSSLILNEKTIIEKTIVGSIPVPNYWYTGLYVKKLFNYYYEQNEQNMVDKICEVLELQNIGYTKDGICDEVKQLVKNAEKRFTPLYDIQAPLKIYASEVEAIKQLTSISTQRIAFSILMLSKIGQWKGYKSDSIDYSPNAFAIYAQANLGVVCDALYELQQAGVITIPLIDYGLYCNILADDGEVVYEIIDEFETSKKHYDIVFDNSCSKIVLEIPVDSNEFTVHYGYSKINPNRKKVGKKTVHTSNIRNGVIKFERMSLGNSYWIEIDKDIADNKDKQMLIANKLRDMAKTYRKRVKKEGTEQLLMEMTEFVQQLG